MTQTEVNQLGYDIIACAITVHKTLGPGLLESVYEKCLVHQLLLNGFEVRQQIKMPISYREIKIDSYIKADIMVNSTILLELKTVEEIHPIYKAQLLSYLKLLNCPKGIIISF